MNPAAPTGSRGRALLGTATILALVSWCLLVFSGGLEALTAEGGRTVRAQFATSARLSENDPVRIHGVTVGRVTGIHAAAGGRGTTVTLTVENDAPPLYRDATAAIEWRTLLGGSYQLVLDPGHARAGRAVSDEIPASRTRSQVEFDELLSALRGGERRGLQTMLAELPAGLASPTAADRALRVVADEARPVAAGLSALRGRHERELRGLVSNAARTMRALEVRSPTLGDVIEGGAVTLGTTARRSTDIEQAIERGATTLPEIRVTIDRLRATLRRADPVLASLRSAAPRVATSVRRLRPVVADASRLLGDARPVARSLRGSAAALARASASGRPVLDGLLPILERLDGRILPDLAKPDPVTKLPTYQMIGPTLSALAAAAGGYDQVSHILSLAAGGGERAFDTLPCHTYFGNAAAAKKVACQDLVRYLPALLGAPPPTTHKAR